MNDLSSILIAPPEQAARRLLGSFFIRTIDDHEIVCRIVETEAYDQDDPASHSFRGKTPRTEVMFGPPGYLYVYFTYGMHHCMNIVTGPEGHGSAVLIRALEPVSGLELIKANRHNIKNDLTLTNGPGKLCQALAVGREFNGQDLSKKPLELIIKGELKNKDIAVSKRIGISKAIDKKWRFFIKDSPYVSKAY